MTGPRPVSVDELVIGNNYIVDSREPGNISNRTLATYVKKLCGILVFRNVNNEKLTFIPKNTHPTHNYYHLFYIPPPPPIEGGRKYKTRQTKLRRKNRTRKNRRRTRRR